ncbi:PspC domain-containing protein [Granulicatella elegans]|uniref:PspC domain-containing protein n=1 Tax=Granulicatella elegans TaxID=137732 RepID=UPI001D15C454|nr:PspC domain-containing protein [Granulicatella elegans]UEA30623.1 PspC domain-containing protein [Granulicatella elegans]
MKRKRLMRSKDNRILAGVIGGVAEYLDVDASILRVIFVFLTWSGMPILLYILLAIIIPSEKRPRNQNYYYDSYNRPRKEARKVEEDDSDWSDF